MDTETFRGLGEEGKEFEMRQRDKRKQTHRDMRIDTEIDKSKGHAQLQAHFSYRPIHLACLPFLGKKS